MITEIIKEIREKTDMNDKILNEIEIFMINNEYDIIHMIKLKDLICNISTNKQSIDLTEK